MKDNIQKFIDAQNAPGYTGYANAVTELTRGKKLSHWIWYVFPQLKSISQNSPFEKKYGIEDLEEARGYLNNPILKSRLDEVCSILMNHQGKTASSIFGMSDAAKVKSSMTLFYLASKNELYRQVLDKFFNGLPCQKTLYALNLTMPSRGTITSHDEAHSKNGPNKPQTSRNIHTTNGRSHVISNNSDSKSSKTRKIKKLMILLLGALFVVSAFGGIGYGVFALLSHDILEVPIVENSSPNIDKPSISEKSIALVLRSSDRDIIGKDEIEKYYIRVSASLGGKVCIMDTTTNSYNFKFTNENFNEAIILNVSIEDCAIGEATYVYNDLDANNDNFEESVTLTVSSTDLRIYEELAWYVSAEQQVSKAKYPKYVERIKMVKNENFATLLTNKLNSIEKASPKSVEDSKETSKKNSDNLPDEIMHRIRTGRMVPASLISKLPSFQGKITKEYNYFVSKRDANRNVEILHELRHCKTFRELQHIMRKYH